MRTWQAVALVVVTGVLVNVPVALANDDFAAAVVGFSVATVLVGIGAYFVARRFRWRTGPLASAILIQVAVAISIYAGNA